MQVAHFLEADVTAWATALHQKLFSPNRQWLERLKIWRLMEQFINMDGVLAAVFRPPSATTSLDKQLQQTPHSWRPLLVEHSVTDGKWQPSGSEVQQCWPFAHTLSNVDTLHLRFQTPRSCESPECRLLSAMPALRSLKIMYEPTDPADITGRSAHAHLAAALTPHSRLAHLF